MKKQIKTTLKILATTFLFTSTTLAAPDAPFLVMSSPERGTYSTSHYSSLNSYIGMYKAKKYHIYDGAYQVQPTLEIRKVASHQPYGYTVKINFPCASKNGPATYSINYSGDQVELFNKGTGQCTIAGNFTLYMSSQLDMIDGGLSNHRITLHIGLFNPTFHNGYIEFEMDHNTP